MTEMFPIMLFNKSLRFQNTFLKYGNSAEDDCRCENVELVA